MIELHEFLKKIDYLTHEKYNMSYNIMYSSLLQGNEITSWHLNNSADYKDLRTL